jgi:ketosteroid isomerase-like protein
MTHLDREAPMDQRQTDVDEIIQLERHALERWCRGDPSGFLEISARDVVYFDPFLERRLDGLPALSAYYEGLRGKISAGRFELLHPRVQLVGDAAVLTFNFASSGVGGVHRWNCTEVYRRDADGWRIIQTHWSFAGPPAAGSA